MTARVEAFGVCYWFVVIVHPQTATKSEGWGTRHIVTSPLYAHQDFEHLTPWTRLLSTSRASYHGTTLIIRRQAYLCMFV